MPANGEQSPRAAIQQWLRHASSAEINHEASGIANTDLANRLGLGAPFRSFGGDSLDPSPSDPVARHKKRDRHIRSSSSVLEPAAADTVAGKDELTSKKKVYHDSQDQGGSPLNAKSILHNLSPGPTPIVQKPQKTYQRRPRHKTLEDKYQMKEKIRCSKKPEEDHRKQVGKRRKCRGKEKSGNTLLHDFKASNVAQDRLTMRPAASLGLFGKGRASSPLKRKGLPDLTFSELAFLGSHRKSAKASNEDVVNSKKRRKKDNAANTEAQISRYFTHRGLRTVPESEGARENRRPDNSGQDSCRVPRDSSLSYVDLPDKPFLGFGSSGADFSPVKHHLGSENRSSSESTSYYTWSKTSEVSRSSVKRYDKHIEEQSSCRGSSKSSSTIGNPDLQAESRGQRENHDEIHRSQVSCRHQDRSFKADNPNGAATNTSLKPTAEDLNAKQKSLSEADVAYRRGGEKATSTTQHSKAAEHDGKDITNDPIPQSNTNMQTHLDTLVNLDIALKNLLQTCQASLAEHSVLKESSGSQEKLCGSSENQVSAPGNEIDDQDGTAIQVQEIKTSEAKNGKPPIQPLATGSQGSATARMESNKPLSAKALDVNNVTIPLVKSSLTPVEADRDFDLHFAWDRRRPYIDQTMQRRGFPSGFWSSFNNIYERQAFDEAKRDWPYQENVLVGQDQTPEPAFDHGSMQNVQPDLNQHLLRESSHGRYQYGSLEPEAHSGEADEWGYRTQQVSITELTELGDSYGNHPSCYDPAPYVHNSIKSSAVSVSPLATPMTTFVYESRYPEEGSSHNRDTTDLGTLAPRDNRLTYYEEQEFCTASATDEYEIPGFWKPNKLY